MVRVGRMVALAGGTRRHETDNFTKRLSEKISPIRTRAVAVTRSGSTPPPPGYRADTGKVRISPPRPLAWRRNDPVPSRARQGHPPLTLRDRVEYTSSTVGYFTSVRHLARLEAPSARM